ncbi:MarR family winged helix-turn-helix transcriptional regulator [Humibacter ginsengisoli]
MLELSQRDADARAAVNALTRASRVLERSLPELSLADFRVLSAVAEGEARASRLAHRLALGKPAISSTVDSLVRRGLLSKQAHDADQRATDLVLTASGEVARSAAEQALVAVVTQLVDDTDDAAATLTALASLETAIERRQASIAAARHAAAVGAAGSADLGAATRAASPAAVGGATRPVSQPSEPDRTPRPSAGATV